MGSKSQPAPPPPVDPSQVIGAEAQANRVNQVTPYGSLTYSGPDNNTANLNLSPDVQNLFNSQLGISQGVLNQANSALGRLPQGNPYAGFDVGGYVPGLQGISQGLNPQVPQLGQVGVQAQQTPNLQTSVQGLGQLQNPNLQQSVNGLDFSKAYQLPQNYQGFNQNAANAFYNNSAGLLNQQFTRDQNALDQKLANQGLQSGGAAFNDQQNIFQTNKDQTFGNLANQAVMYGGQDASRQLADQLSLNNAGTNQAQAQFNAGLSQGSFGNQAALSQAGVANQNAQTQFGAGLDQGNFSNQALGQQFGLGTTQWGQNLQNQLAGNDVLSQQYGLQNQSLANQQNLVNQSNAIRSQGINEAGLQNNAQFNQIASLLGLQQVQAPQLSNFAAPGQVNAGDAYALQQAGQQANYNTASNAASSKKGSSANLAGTLGGAAIKYGPALAAAMSDRRLKTAITKIGKYKNYNVYLWTWNKIAEGLGLKGHGLGVIADEIPLPFVRLVGEYLAVDYGAL